MRCLPIALLMGCGVGSTIEPVDRSWELVWSDEFDGPADSPPNPDNWVYNIGGDGWGNNQLEYNTDQTSNVRHDGDGFLRIVARQESFEGNDYTSARITTKDRYEFTYGRVEARIRLPEGRGIWPAFWMLGANFDEVGWPACGEIDILELRGDEPEVVLGTVHGPGYAAGESISGEYEHDQSVANDFHVYAVEWDPEHITWFFDDEVVHTVNPGDLPGTSPWVFDGDFFLILNVAVGGTFLEDPDETTEFPATMGVDYIRVYERQGVRPGVDEDEDTGA